MKIIHVITGMQKAAGTSVFCGEVCNGLAAAGHDVTIAVIDPTRADCYPIDPRIKLIPIDTLFKSTRSTCSTWFNIIHIHALWLGNEQQEMEEEAGLVVVSEKGFGKGRSASCDCGKRSRGCQKNGAEE